jgi:hypothetical protein
MRGEFSSLAKHQIAFRLLHKSAYYIYLLPVKVQVASLLLRLTFVLYNGIRAMAQPISSTIPARQLHRLEFLLGEASGLQTLYPPGGQPVQFQANVVGSWEHCERFIKLDFYAEIPNLGPETFRALITYSETLNCYRMWAFSSSQEEPLHLTGDFFGDDLVLVSDPTMMIWGLQRLRYTFTPQRDDSVQMLGERWEPDGYAKYCSVVYRPSDICV